MSTSSSSLFTFNSSVERLFVYVVVSIITTIIISTTTVAHTHTHTHKSNLRNRDNGDRLERENVYVYKLKLIVRGTAYKAYKYKQSKLAHSSQSLIECILLSHSVCSLAYSLQLSLMHGFGYRFLNPCRWISSLLFLRLVYLFFCLLSTVMGQHTANTAGGGQYFFFSSFVYRVYVRASNVLSIRMYTRIQTVNGVDLSPALFFRIFSFQTTTATGVCEISEAWSKQLLVLILFISPLKKAPRLIEIVEMNFTLVLYLDKRFQLHTDMTYDFFSTSSKVFFRSSYGIFFFKLLCFVWNLEFRLSLCVALHFIHHMWDWSLTHGFQRIGFKFQAK